MSDPTRTARRTVLTAGAAALAGGALTACGGGDGETKPKSESGSAVTPSAATPAAPAASAPAASQPAAGGKAIAKAADVPVGGGTVLKDEKLVVTQPTAGSFRCFSAVCTHSGCLVNKVADGSIDCPCHGSKFKDTDGAVTKGPATRPLPEKKIKVAADGSISLA
ncbi:Rieske (2Fe-2S) protein [Streptomyces sp. CB00455]|uniref:Rieske (2Fe-2S) protein n=1 Tax=Streptomyces sp. CB00455 TaxID=1703927 RepID=UPI00093B56D2|nr:Rieske (2Fe-2S) protein [Streptomyces sp. CB00455]OKK14627.1 Rieske (2Fe-2S) protein [Streptomyces sp. CB00455]